MPRCVYQAFLILNMFRVWRPFFSRIGGRALLMHGTEGEVYANPQRCPQISLIDSRGVQVLHERQSDTYDEPLSLPATKDPEITARWIERCLAGHEPVPQSLKRKWPVVWLRRERRRR